MKFCHKGKSVKNVFDVSKIVKMSYVPGVSERLNRNFRSSGFQNVYENRFNNRSLFTRLKNKDPDEIVSNMVYHLQCNDCEGSYVGQSKRYLKERIKSHVHANNEQTALKKHCQEFGHNFNFRDPKMLVKEKNTQARLFHEAIDIKKTFRAVNSITDTQCLSAIYDPILLGSA